MSRFHPAHGKQFRFSYARNYIALAADATFFELAMSLISMTTVIPALVDALGGSASMVGLITGVRTGAWLLPQLFVANRIARLERRKPLLLKVTWLGRPLFFILAALVLLVGNTHPTLVLWCMVVIFGLFFVLDSVVAVPWMDLLSVAIPQRRRGRLMGTAQVLGGLGGIAMGGVVSYLLGPGSRWNFPANYALILGLAAFALVLNAVGLSTVREPENCYPQATTPTVAETLHSIPRLLKEDRAFLRLILAKISLGYITMASSFYVLHAVQRGGLPIASTGLLISAQVAGTVAAGLLTSVIQDALGPRTHLLITCVLAVMPPVAALLFSLTAGGLSIPLAAYMALFFVLGISFSSSFWPFFNYILEHASAEHRPVYIGTLNTLAALTMLAPMVGGLLVDNLSYEAVFIAATAAALTALLLGLSLPSTRHSLKDPTPRVDAE